MEQLALGSVPTWNSPDVITNRWSPWRLLEEFEVKVRNLSPEVPAVNGIVHVFYGPFGLGMQRNPLGSRVVTVAAGTEIAVTLPLGPSLLGGEQRISVHIVIDHPHDSQLINNRASQITYGVLTSEAGRDPEFTFPVLNQSAAARQITLHALPNDLAAVVTPAVRTYAPWEQFQATLVTHVPGSLHGAPGADVRREVTVVARDPAGAVIDGITHIIRIDN